MSGVRSREIMLVVGEISTLERMSWIQWKRSEITGRIRWEVGGVSFDNPFSFFTSTRRRKELFVL